MVLALLLMGEVKDYRGQMKQPPFKVFEGMLLASKKENWSGIKDMSDMFLGPFYQEIKRSFNVDLAEELNKVLAEHNKEKILTAIQRNMFYDIKALFGLAAQDPAPDRATGLLKTAYLDYNLLSPYVQTKDFQRDQVIRKMFQQAFQLAGASSPYSEENKGNNKGKKLKDHTSQIEKAIIEVLPGVSAAGN
jgi:hypothetical protein